jgi:hypothetical protein
MRAAKHSEMPFTQQRASHWLRKWRHSCRDWQARSQQQKVLQQLCLEIPWALCHWYCALFSRACNIPSRRFAKVRLLLRPVKDINKGEWRRHSMPPMHNTPDTATSMLYLGNGGYICRCCHSGAANGIITKSTIHKTPSQHKSVNLNM